MLHQMTFEETPEWKQSLAMRPACDAVLCEVFRVAPAAIERFEKTSPLFILDKEHSIDMRVRMHNGSHLLGQEKALSNKFWKFRTFTIEFWQNRFTQEPGEFFKIASQFYLHGYSDETGVSFVEWKVLDVLRLIDWLKGCGVDALSRRTRPAGGSRAAFLPIEYDKIPHEFVIAAYRRPQGRLDFGTANREIARGTPSRASEGAEIDKPATKGNATA